MNEEYFERVKKQVVKMQEYEEMEKISGQKNRTEINDLVSTINIILQDLTGQKITKDHIKFYPKYIGNTGIGETLDKKLSQIIFDYYYPKSAESEYAHYTSVAALKNILLHKKIRLTSTIKRLKDNEFKLFYSDYNLKGYEKVENGNSYDENLMSQLFYISLTESKNELFDDTRFLWDNFGNAGKGIKLIFDIETNHPDFRKVFYQNNETKSEDSLLHRIAKMIDEKYQQVFVYAGVSKMGSFYIDDKFNKEIESRFLIKKWSDNYSQDFNFEILEDDDGFPFIELDFQSEWGNFNLKQIQPGSNCDKSIIEDLVAKSNLDIEVLNNAISIDDLY